LIQWKCYSLQFQSVALTASCVTSGFNKGCREMLHCIERDNTERSKLNKLPAWPSKGLPHGHPCQSPVELHIEKTINSLTFI
jgi:hypothetical protein